MKHSIRGRAVACAILSLSLIGPKLWAQEAAEIPYTLPGGWVLHTDTGIPLMLRVLKADGSPLSKAIVSIVNLEGKDVNAGHSTKSSALSKTGFHTDENGVYHVMRVKTGRYSLYVRAPGHGIAVVPDLKIDEQNPQPVTVRLQAEGSLRLRSLRAGTQAPLGGARLQLVPFDADSLVDGDKRDEAGHLDWMLPVSDVHRFTRDGDGLLEMGGLRPGMYWATLALPGYRVAGLSPIQTIKIEAGRVTTLDVTMEPEVGAPLTLLILGSNGVPQVRRDQQIVLQEAVDPVVKIELSSRVATAMLGNTQSSASRGSMMRRARTDGSGHLTLDPIPRGRWRVSLYGVVMKEVEVEVGAQGGEGVLQPESAQTAGFDEAEAAAIIEK